MQCSSTEEQLCSTFRCMPMMLPWLPNTTAVFQMTSPCASSRSKIGLTMTCDMTHNPTCGLNLDLVSDRNQ